MPLAAFQEKQYVNVLKVYVETQQELLTIDQRLVYKLVMENIWGENCGIIFWMHQGGRKDISFIFNARGNTNKALYWSGIIRNSSNTSRRGMHCAFGSKTVTELKSSRKFSLKYWKNIWNGNGSNNMLSLFWMNVQLFYKCPQKRTWGNYRTMTDFRSDQRQRADQCHCLPLISNLASNSKVITIEQS